MPHYHCEKCQHEWDGNLGSKCDWCNSDGYILEKETALEKQITQIYDFIEVMEDTSKCQE